MITNDEKGYGFYFGPGIMFLEFKVPMTGSNVQDAYNEVKESFPNTEIKIIAYKNLLGYWAAYNISNHESIYCGTMSLKDTKEKISKYLEYDSRRMDRTDEKPGI